MNVLVTLNPGIGEDLGPNFLITSDVEGWSDTATDVELYAGVELIVPDEATVIYIQSLGICLNILTIPIETIYCSLDGDAIEITTTTTTTTEVPVTTTTTSSTSTITSTSSTTTTSTTTEVPETTTTTTTAFVCNLNYSVDSVEEETTTTTTTTI